VNTQVQDGAKGVKVGKRIAVFAEENDDLDTLEIPKEEEKQAAATPKKSEESEEKESESKEGSSKKSKQSSSSSPSSSSSSKESKPPSQNTNVEDTAASSRTSQKSQKYPLYPSVQMLLHSNGLSASDANNIPATGPNGRLLKGDVLAHLGKLSEKSYPESQAKRIQQLSHLDLSNIKKATAPEPTAKKEKAAAAAEEEPRETQITLPISLSAVLTTQKRIQDSLGLHLPLSTFIARASELANEDLPRGRSSPPTSGELFDAVLGLDKVKGKQTSRGNYVPQVTVVPTPSMAASLSAAAQEAQRRKKLDIIDFLAGKKVVGGVGGVSASTPMSVGSSASGNANNVFSVIVKKGDEKRARVYLERVKTVLEQEPGELVL